MKYNKDYYQKNKEAILKRQRAYYWKDPERYREYGREYKKRNKEKRKQYDKKYRSTVNGIWVKLGGRKRKITKDDFIKWYTFQEKKCVYCGIEEARIEKDFMCWSGTRLQIDRKDNKKGYEKNNIVLACPVCNFIKGNYFTFKEMLEIGKVVRKVLNKRKKPMT